MLESAPEKCVFTNHVPRLRLKINLVTQTKFVSECGRVSLYNAKVIKMSRLAIDRLFILRSIMSVGKSLGINHEHCYIGLYNEV